MANEKHISLDLLKQFATGFKGKFDALLNNKVDKVAGKQLSTEDYTTAEKSKLSGLKNYTLPTASSTTLGGVKVGAGLTIDGEGNLSATGGGEADSVNWDNVVGKPTKLSEFENDSDFQTSTQVSAIVDGKIVGKADKTYVDTELGKKANTSHTHTKAQITDFPTSMKNPTAMKVQLNGGTTEGTNQFTYDGSAAKNINITAALVGAAATSHTHTKAQITDMPTKLSQFTNDSGFQTAANVDTKLADYAKKTDIASVYKYKGSKANYAALPASENVVGDVWNVEAADSAHGIKAGDNVAWDGTKWDVLAGTIDTSAFATKTELGNKVDKVTGKGLSTNDFTNEYKTKLDNLENVTIDFATTGDIDNIITEVFG